jgi:transcriptional regulator with XRE-family HTH domain
MTTESDYLPEQRYAELTPAKVLRIARELQGLTQTQLAAMTGIPQSTISAIEHGQKGLGIERAKVFARALKIHPAVLAFPDWDEPAEVIDLTKYRLAKPKRARARKAAPRPAKRRASGR